LDWGWGKVFPLKHAELGRKKKKMAKKKPREQKPGARTLDGSQGFVKTISEKKKSHSQLTKKSMGGGGVLKQKKKADRPDRMVGETKV